jgi:hypothetical protein
MALDAPQLQRIAGLIAGAESVRAAAAAIRQAFPQVRALVVDALDVRGEQPVFSVGDRQVYLIESNGHCWEVTRDPNRAYAVMLAEGQPVVRPTAMQPE